MNTRSSSSLVAAYQRERLAPLTVLIDEHRVAYRSYGLGRGSVWRVWSPKI